MRRDCVRAIPDRTVALKTIEGLLDYAILESAELGLPFIVCLLRMARLELEATVISKGRTAPRSGAARGICLR
jgi:hypothetical protein